MNVKRYTGKYYYKDRWLRKPRLYVEVIATSTCPYSFSESPEHSIFIKATQEDLCRMGLNIPLVKPDNPKII